MAATPTQSFLAVEDYPDSQRFLPPPPATTSVDFSRDIIAYYEGQKLRGTPRWKQAIKDADLDLLGDNFSEALGVHLSAKNTPIMYSILQKIRVDSGDFAPKKAKENYRRIRPFMFFKGKEHSSCTPGDEDALKKNGSYPSGHTTIGWSTAMILAEIRPERQTELFKRAYEFGQSRVICGVHWKSDVEMGYLTGAAAATRLHTDPEFMKEFEQAKAEIRAKIK